MAFRFDRSKKQLAIGGDEGVAFLLVKNNRLFVRVFRDAQGAPTYLVVEKPTAIGWDDVDAATQAIRMKCPLSDPVPIRCSCILLPFLDGGMKRLFGEKSEMVNENDSTESMLFAWGNSDCRIGVGLDQPKLDPKRAPLCVRTKSGSAIWTYAFDRFSGMMNAVRGIVPSEQVTGAHGRQFEIMIGKSGSFTGGPSADPTEVSFDLPKDAKVVELSGLRKAYLNALSEDIGADKLIEIQTLGQASLRTITEDEIRIAARIAKQNPAAEADKAQLKKDESELAEIRGRKADATFAVKELQAINDELQKAKSPNSRK